MYVLGVPCPEFGSRSTQCTLSSTYIFCTVLTVFSLFCYKLTVFTMYTKFGRGDPRIHHAEVHGAQGQELVCLGDNKGHTEDEQQGHCQGRGPPHPCVLEALWPTQRCPQGY